MTDRPDETAYVGATLIDGTGAGPLRDSAVMVSGGRIGWVGASSDLPRSPGSRVVDVSGKYILPGLLDANVHLLIHVDPDILLRYEPGCYDDLVLEAAQVALRAGVTTVFDTWGPLESLRRVRDQIAAGHVVGSRIFFAGNIIGNDGPWSTDMFPSLGAGVSSAVVADVNRHWEQGVGAELTWMTADDVRVAVREYIAGSGVDFVKYSSSAHAHSRFIALSPQAQRAIVEEAHAAGMTAQACAQAPEAFRLAIDAGVDLLQHADLTGPRPMPNRTVDAIVERRLPCVLFLGPQPKLAGPADRDLRWRGSDIGLSDVLAAKQINDTNLIEAGATVLLGRDLGVYGPTALTSPMWGPLRDGVDEPSQLGHSHIGWLRRAFELGMDPMRVLLAATRSIAQAYGKADEIGTVETGKHADLLILDADPLTDPDNYSRICQVIKGGQAVDRQRLPELPVLTRDS